MNCLLGQMAPCLAMRFTAGSALSGICVALVAVVKVDNKLIS